VLDRAGDAYITDFGHAVIYRASARQLRAGKGTVRPWLRPRTSQVPDLPAGGNLNGIALTPDGKSLIVGQTGNGALYRITIATRAVSRIAVRGGALDGSDGIRLDGRTGYVVTHQRGVAVLSFSKSYARAKITKVLTDPSLSMPTSVTRVAGRLLVTNAIKAVGAPSYTLTSLKP
jgi:Cu-Zn family superoxide dismutase